jgi:hypothetical protein
MLAKHKGGWKAAVRDGFRCAGIPIGGFYSVPSPLAWLACARTICIREQAKSTPKGSPGVRAAINSAAAP